MYNAGVKLGVLLDRFQPPLGGAEAHTAALLQRAVEAGDRAVLAVMAGQVGAEAVPAGVTTIEVPVRGGRPERDEAFAMEGARRLRDAGCDIVFAIRHALDCDVYMPHGGLVRDARDAKDAAVGGPGLATRLGRAFSRKFDFFLRAEQALLGETAGPAVVAVSHTLAARMHAVYPRAAHRIAVVANGVDGEHFRRAPFHEAGAALRAAQGMEDAYVGLLLARNVVLKGLATALEAMAHEEIRALERPFHLLVAGGRVPGRLARLGRKLGVASRVHALGTIGDPRPAYAAADVLVHPTWYDPCSLVCLEALAMELPVITTPVNGVKDAMGQKGGIVLEEPGNAAALAVALRVLADAELRAATSDDARYLAQRNRLPTRLDQVLDVCRESMA